VVNVLSSAIHITRSVPYISCCRYNLLETVRNNVKLLNEMLDCYQMAGGSSGSDKDIIKVHLFKQQMLKKTNVETF